MALLSGWTRYRPVTIGPLSSGASTNVNFRITVPFDSDMQTQFQDIRFTDSDGTTLLEQWREAYTESDTAEWWFLVPSVPEAGAELRMYFGNSNASLSSDGEACFPNLFDDFTGDNGDPPDVTKWTISDNAYVQIQSNNLRIQITWTELTHYARSITTLPSGNGVKLRVKRVESGLGFLTSGWQSKHYYKANNSSQRWYYNNGDVAEAVAIGDDTFHTIEIRRVADNDVRYYFDNALHTTASGASVSGNILFEILYTGPNPSGDVTVDWAFMFGLTQDDSAPEIGLGPKVSAAPGCVSWTQKAAAVAAWVLKPICAIIASGIGESEQTYYLTNSKIIVKDFGDMISEQTYYGTSTTIVVHEVDEVNSEQTFYGTGTKIKVRSVA